MKPFLLQPGLLPLLVSNPHSGTFIPPEIAETMTEAGLEKRDTDWFLARLYDFSILKRAAVLKSNLSRYVVDLNRPPNNESLYPGQATTEICPRYTFANLPIYRDGQQPEAAEVEKRIEHYWRPYHQQLGNELNRLVDRFGFVIMLDVHSIAGKLPRLFDGELPDFNFGTNYGKSCGTSLQDAIAEFAVSITGYSQVMNGRFIGGYITRHYGAMQKVHAVQLELNRSVYMDESTLNWNDRGASRVRPVLERLLNLLGEWSQTEIQR